MLKDTFLGKLKDF